MTRRTIVSPVIDPAQATLTRWLVDAMNVIGTRPDGWWRDREGAVRRLLEELREFADGGERVTVVLDYGPPEIARLLDADDDPASVRVVTSDGELAARARALGAAVEGAGTFRRRL